LLYFEWVLSAVGSTDRRSHKETLNNNQMDESIPGTFSGTSRWAFKVGLRGRPAVSKKRLSLTSNGNIRYQLKTPYSDGTTHVIFEPLDFMARLAALVPKPRVNLTRFHGVFAGPSE
jgi:hypothetical protein